MPEITLNLYYQIIRMNKRKKAYGALFATVLFWGFSFISTKIALGVFPPMSLGLLRFFIALIFLFIIKQKLAPKEKLNPKTIPYLFAAGFSGVTMYFFFENNGIALVSASEASIVVSSIPVLIMITDRIIGKIKKEPVNFKPVQWIGCLISIGGVWLVAGVSFAISGSFLGYIYMVGAALSWVIYSFLTRTLFKSHSVIFIVFWQSAAGFICFIPFSVMELHAWGQPSVTIIVHLLFLGILCSAIGHWFYVLAIENLNVSVSGIFLNLIPLVTVAAGFFMLGERLAPMQWCGAVLVIGGVTLAGWKKKPPVETLL